MALTMSIDEQIGRIVLAHQDGLEQGREEERQKSAATISKLQEESAVKDARIRELEAALASKG